MEALIIDAGKDTPQIILDVENEKFLIKGKSYPENALTFFGPILDWLNEYVKNPLPKTNFDINVTYVNSISNKMVLDVFKTLSKIEAPNELVVRWHHKEDNEDIQELGEEFGDLIQIPMEFVIIE